MKKFRTIFNGKSNIIEEVEVEKEAGSSVWIDGIRHSKFNKYEQYHKSWEEAKAYLMNLAEEKLMSARFELQKAQAFHDNVSGLKPPEEKG